MAAMYEVKVIAPNGAKLRLTAIGFKAYCQLVCELENGGLEIEADDIPYSAYKADQIEKAVTSAKQFVETA
jgi:hypothetical protein